jgi:hypothetical protein
MQVLRSRRPIQINMYMYRNNLTTEAVQNTKRPSAIVSIAGGPTPQQISDNLPQYIRQVAQYVSDMAYIKEKCHEICFHSLVLRQITPPGSKRHTQNEKNSFSNFRRDIQNFRCFAGVNNTDKGNCLSYYTFTYVQWVLWAIDKYL